MFFYSISVSYTHLIMSELSKFVASREQVEDKMRDFCSHLDVYKRQHYHIRLLQFVAGDILYVQIDSYHAVMEVEGLVHTQV